MLSDKEKKFLKIASKDILEHMKKRYPKDSPHFLIQCVIDSWVESDYLLLDEDRELSEEEKKESVDLIKFYLCD